MRLEKTLLLISSLLAALAASPATEGAVCSTRAAGDWTTRGTWTGGSGCAGATGGIPGTNDSVTINHAVTVSSDITVNEVTAINAGGSITVTGNNNNFIVNLTTTISGGSLALDGGGGTKRFSGLVTITSGSWTNAGNNAINFRGTGSPLTGGGVINSGTFDNGTGTVTFNNDGGNPFTIGGTGNMLFDGGITVSGVEINRTNTATVTITGRLNGSNAGSTWRNNAGTLLYTNDSGTNSPPMNTGVLEANNATNTVVYGRAGTQTVKTTDYRNLTLQGSGAKTFAAGLTINGDLTLDGSATLTAGTFTHDLNGNFIIDTSAGTPLSATGASRFNFNAPFTGAAATTMGGTTTATIAFADAWIRNPSGVTFSDSASFSSGTSPTLVVVSGATLTPGPLAVISGTGTLTGDATEGAGTVQVTRVAPTANPDFATQYSIATKTLLNAGGTGNHMTVDYSGAGNQTVTSVTYGHLKLSGSGTKTMPASALAVNGNFLMAGSASATAASAMTVGGNFDLSAVGTTATFNAATFTHNVAGDISKAATATFTPATSTFNLNGTALQTITGAITFNHLTVSNTTSPTSVTMASDVTANGNIANAGTLGGAGRIVLSGGSAPHQLSGAGSYTNLQMNDAQGAVLSASQTVNGTLTLTNGNITTGSINTLNVGSAGVVSGGSNSSHVVGSVAKTYTATGSYTFPVGDGSTYTPLAADFTSLTSSGVLTVTGPTPGADHPDTTSVTSMVNPSRSVNRYWTVKRNGALAGTFNATLTYPSSVVDNPPTANTMIVARGTICGGTSASRSCSTTWTRPTLGTVDSVHAVANGIVLTSTSESDFVVGEPQAPRFAREREFIFTRERY